MEALQNNLRKFLLPIAQKIEKQRHLQAIKEGMISITPIIIVGSLSMLFMALNNMLPEGSAKHYYLKIWIHYLSLINLL